MRILLTGATGFIGKNLLSRLLEKQYSVLSLVSKLQNEYGVLTEIEAFNPDVVYHFAANQATTSFPIFSSEQDIKTNIVGTWNLLKALRNSDVKLIVNAGSSSEYGFKDDPMNENDVLEPNSYHSFSKGAQTNLVQTYGLVENKPVITLRLFSVYGPHERKTRLIPAVIDACLNKKELKLSSPGVVRDFVYVDDIVDVCTKIDVLKQHTGQIFNIGTRVQTSIQEVVDTCSRLTGYTPKCLWNEDQRTWDTKNWVSDCSKTEKLLGWKSKTSIEDGLKKTIEWTEKYGK